MTEPIRTAPTEPAGASEGRSDPAAQVTGSPQVGNSSNGIGGSTSDRTARPTRTRMLTAVVGRVVRSKSGLVVLAYLVLLTCVALLAPVISPHSPREQDLMNAFAPIFSADHLLGTDHLGRDVLSRLMHASRIALVAPLIAVGLAITVGIPLGLASGYIGGWLDTVSSRIADSLLALPGIVLALALVGVLGPNLTNAMIAVGIGFTPLVFRMVRGATLDARSELYIDAARVSGSGPLRIMLTHVLPNIRGPLFVQIPFLMGLSLLFEAGLSFLGVGVQLPDASWGVMLREAADNNFSAPWSVVPPGVAIALTILCLNLLGDAVRDAVGGTSTTAKES